jgi:hypothetical protein
MHFNSMHLQNPEPLANDANGQFNEDLGPRGHQGRAQAGRRQGKQKPGYVKVYLRKTQIQRLLFVSYDPNSVARHKTSVPCIYS